MINGVGCKIILKIVGLLLSFHTHIQDSESPIARGIPVFICEVECIGKIRACLPDCLVLIFS